MNQKTQNHLSLAPEMPLFITVSVEFGQRLANGNCGHVGICKIGDAALPGAAPQARKGRCRRAIAHISVGATGHPIFFFSKHKMLPCTARVFFRGPAFQIPEPFELPGTWQHELPQLQFSQLEAGTYPIEKYEAGFLIRF